MSLSEPISFDFRKPQNKEQLLDFLGISEDLLEKAINKTDIYNNPNKESVLYFIKHMIPKKNKHQMNQYRTVWEAGYYLTDIYKAFARKFDLFLHMIESRYPHPCAFGYVKGKNTIENAIPHCGKKLILHADIENFFSSISTDKIYQKFIELHIHEEVSSILARFLTIENSLPLGLHPSPMLANFVCIDLDDKLSKLAQQYGCLYTRYADDISISSNVEVPTKEEIKNLLNEEGFTLSERKFRITKPGQAHYVTGLSVSNIYYPRAPRSMKKKLRQELYYCKKFGISEHLCHLNDNQYLIMKGINRIDGTVRYVTNIEKGTKDLHHEWKKLLQINNIYPSYHPREDRPKRNITFYIDECEIEFEGKKAMAISLTSMHKEDQSKIEAITIKTLHNYLIHPFSGGHKNTLEKKKLHFTDANENLRHTYIEKISTLRFRGYIAFGILDTEKAYENLYLSLMKNILPHRLMDCDNAYVQMVFEENPKVKPKKIEQMVNDVYEELESTDNRRPIHLPDIIVGKKAEHPCFSIPDFLLGVWREYIERQDRSDDSPRLRFEWLRDKYRIIFDADKNIYYSRKRPFLSKYWNISNQ